MEIMIRKKWEEGGGVYSDTDSAGPRTRLSVLINGHAASC